MNLQNKNNRIITYHIKEAPMINTKILVISAMILLFCSPNSKESKCKDPGSCNNCFRIYDSQGNYVDGGPLSEDLSHAYWDGRDCNGDSVACGKYKAEYAYQGQHISDEIIVTRPGATVVHNQSSCDSLRKACSGFFYEEQTVLGYTCICCQ
jgi:hypothetical protein